jgi:hypothetical protein
VQDEIATGFWSPQFFDVKFIEEQLVSILRDTPLETDCSLSVSAMELADIRGMTVQEEWLNERRPAVGARGWHLCNAHWEYGAPPIEVQPRGQLGYAMPPRLVSPPSPNMVVPQIVVKPLQPLTKRTRAGH